MKKIFILSLLFMTFGLWASSKNFSFEEIAYEPVNRVEVQITQSIIDVFADEDHDEDDEFADGIFADVEPFLKGEKDRTEITQDVIEYIEFILDNDKDDVNDLIRGELNSVVKRGSVEESYMIIGTRKYKCSLSYMN